MAAVSRLAEKPLGVKGAVKPAGSVAEDGELVLEVYVDASKEDGLVG